MTFQIHVYPVTLSPMNITKAHRAVIVHI